MWNFFGDLNTPHSTCYYDSGGAFNFYKHIFDQVIVSADTVSYTHLTLPTTSRV